jgi:hypothetical protein
VSSGFLAEACPARHDPENPLSNPELSKTAEKPPNHDHKHCMFQVSKQKETLKPQNQPQPAKEAPQKQELSLHNNFGDFLKDLERLNSREPEKEGICGRYL